jgi:hypothetical protein
LPSFSSLTLFHPIDSESVPRGIFEFTNFRDGAGVNPAPSILSRYASLERDRSAEQN